MKIEDRDKPLLLALLAIPFSVLVLLATLKFFPHSQPTQQQAQAQAHSGGGDKISFFDWFAAWGAEDFIALFTLATLSVLYYQLRAQGRSNEHFRVTERAYLRMSHVTPDKGKGQAFTFTDDGLPGFRLQIKNWGRTPARILAINIEIIVRDRKHPLPPEPPFKGPAYPQAIFLVPDASFFQSPPFEEPMDVPAIMNGSKILYIIGFVDYEDRFGDRHRSTYGRTLVLDPPSYENNLVFIAEGRYNDDFPIGTA